MGKIESGNWNDRIGSVQEDAECQAEDPKFNPRGLYDLRNQGVIVLALSERFPVAGVKTTLKEASLEGLEGQWGRAGAIVQER